MIGGLIKGIEGVSKLLVWIAGSLILLSAFLVTFEVFARKFFNYSIAGADELSGYALAISTALSLSYTIVHRSNIRVDALYHFLPRTVRAFLDILGMIALTGYLCLVAYLGFNYLLDTIANQSSSITPLKVPLVYPQTPWVIGWTFAAFTGIVFVLIGIISFIKGDFAEVQRRLGTMSIDEQITEETEGAK